jgi:8-oxo-dGTP pyrophosphatase MutT (NUDIX family)
VPFAVAGRRVGSVACHHLPALRRFGAALAVTEAGVALRADEAARDETLAQLNAGLRAEGLVMGWRDETFALRDPRSGAVLGRIERAAARFWGCLTQGAHANGFVRGTDGRPRALWIARRSLSKATDPGKLDNLIGGGVPFAQSPRETLVREGWEEAGLTPQTMGHAQAGRRLHLDCDIPEGCMVETLHVFDLELPAGRVPSNQDGEVSEIALMPVEQAARVAASGEMTVDAALVTLDFLLRHRLLDAAEHERLERQCTPLFEAPHWTGTACNTTT